MDHFYPELYPRRLDSSGSEIRLLQILSDEGDAGPVRCRLLTASLKNNPAFCALSYVWGDPNDTADIFVAIDASTDSDDCAGAQADQHGVVFHGTTNLEAALRHVRAAWAAHREADDQSSFLLWVDAVCINQQDLEERSQQVRLMRAIYKSADLVLAWLGPQDVGIGFRAIEFILRMAANHAAANAFLEFLTLRWMVLFPALCRSDDSDNPWAQVRAILRSPYWERIWIFQEAALARGLLLVGPSCSMPFEHLAFSWDIMRIIFSWIQKTSVTKPTWLSENTWFCLSNSGALSWARISSFISARQDPSLWLGDGELPSGPAQSASQRHRRAWESLFLCSLTLKTTDPKDSVYGLLGLSEFDITPDYSENKTVGEVYIEYMQLWLENHKLAEATGQQAESAETEHRALYFLSYAGTDRPDLASGIPTWVANFPKIACNHDGTCLNMRVVEGRTPYEGVFDATARSIPPRVCGSSLRAYGIKAGSIVRVSDGPILCWTAARTDPLLDLVADFITRHPVYISGATPLGAVQQLVYSDPLAELSRETVLGALALVRYLVLHGGGTRSVDDAMQLLGYSDGHQQASSFNDWLVQAFFPNVDLAALGFDGELESQLRGGDLMEGAWPILLDNLGFIHHLHLIETQDGYLGISRAGTRPGDVVCILEDCQHPMVLRRCAYGDNQFTLVGPAFVTGMMEGEAAEFVKDGRCRPEILWLD